jgi:hypothetical protein
METWFENAESEIQRILWGEWGVERMGFVSLEV